jgi:hypothetical protein
MEEKLPTLTVLGEYKNNRTRVDVMCNICGNTFSPKASSLYMGHGCPYCAGTVGKTTEQFIDEMSKKNPNVKILGKYKNSKTKIETLCNKCGHLWMPTPNTLLKGEGCPKCSGLMKKTQEEFVEEMRIKHPTITVIGEYINNRTKVKCFCNKCKTYFFSAPHTMLSNGNGCSNCTTSRGENKIKEWLNDNGFKYNTQHIFEDCKDVRVLPFDFYIPSYNVAIEYDGIQHFEPKDFFGGEESFNKLKEHDSIKSNYCVENNIRLVRIPYYQYEEIENILENELAS